MNISSFNELSSRKEQLCPCLDCSPSMFLYALNMVVYLGKDDSIEKTGGYKGYITGILMLTRIFTSLFCRQFADVFGKKNYFQYKILHILFFYYSLN
eukprot:snap_masked-scaffold_43-processed-gene-0.15-mRNA-1 protein AED:1.00 eAED:1.00 QI:0/0/0/0/1/1/2/0/96